MKTVLPRRRERTGLLANHNFMLLWAASTASAFGYYITDVAMPLLAIEELHADAFEVGLIKVVEQLPALIFGLVLGVLVDRVRKRQLLMLSDVVRSIALLAIPIATFTGHLSLAIVCVVAFIMGSFNLLFDVSYGAFIPAVVGRDRLAEGNSKIEASYASAQLGGPAIAGALVSLLTAPYAILVTAVTLFTSANFIRQMKTPEVKPERFEDSHIRRDIKEGLDYVWRHRLIRLVLVAGAGMNFFGFMFMAVYILYMKRDLGISDFQVGLIFAIGGVGSLIGTLMAPRINTWFGVGPATVGGALLFGLTGMLIPIVVFLPAYAFPLVIAAEFLQYLCYMPFFLNALTIVQLQSPDALRGRIMSTRKFVTWGAQPFGSLAGGIMGGLISLPWTLAISEFGMLAVGIWLALTPLRHMRVIPELEGAHAHGA